jgi:hypothetical protein
MGPPGLGIVGRGTLGDREPPCGVGSQESLTCPEADGAALDHRHARLDTLERLVSGA